MFSFIPLFYSKLIKLSWQYTVLEVLGNNITICCLKKKKEEILNFFLKIAFVTKYKKKKHYLKQIVQRGAISIGYKWMC